MKLLMIMLCKGTYPLSEGRGAMPP